MCVGTSSMTMANTHNTDDSEEQNKDTHSVNRRRFVKALGVAGSAGVIGTGSARAMRSSATITEAKMEQLQEAQNEFDSDAAVREAVRTHGSELLEILADRGYLESARVADLERVGLEVSSRLVGETATARIHTTKQFGDRELLVAIEPHTDRSYAIFSETETEKATIIDPAEDGEVTPYCLVGNACVSVVIGGKVECVLQDIYCCRSYCYTGSQTGNCSRCYPNCDEACGPAG